jgi:hypothetical protein
MAPCEVCGNNYYLCFEVVTAGNRHVFDCFECAIHKLAPVCASCGCRVIGHGVEAMENIFCSAHCAKVQGITGIRDHVWGKEKESINVREA